MLSFSLLESYIIDHFANYANDNLFEMLFLILPHIILYTHNIIDNDLTLL